MIKKFKNGNIKMKVEKNSYYIEQDGSINERFVHDEMFMADLYFNQINGYMYLTDMNTQRVYDMSRIWNLNTFLDELKECEIMKLYPLSKKESKSLLQDMENGY
jgi:hypothetical protein